MNNLNVPNSDERMLALFSHLSLLLGGIIVPLIIWAVQKDKSQFVKYHSLQSIFYHLMFLVLIILYSIIMLIAILLGGASSAIFNNHYNQHHFPTFLLIILIVLSFGLILISLGGVAYSIYVGIKANQGSYIKMPLIGNIIYKKVFGDN